jgi:hypothetical protein
MQKEPVAVVTQLVGAGHVVEPGVQACSAPGVTDPRHVSVSNDRQSAEQDTVPSVPAPNSEAQLAPLRLAPSQASPF